MHRVGRLAMTKRLRAIVLSGAALAAMIAFTAPHHRADIEILTHRANDLSPQKVEAVVDLGLVGVSVLVTWSQRLNY
jgi:hypothetical protein